MRPVHACAVRRFVIVMSATAAVVSPTPPTAASSDADVSAGEEVYVKCTGCHSPRQNRAGPLHCGVVGRKSASVSDYDYSYAMRASGIVWNAETLDEFLTAPLKMLPGTSMGFAGISDGDERRDLIAWLATLDLSAPACRDILINRRENN